MVAVVFNGRNGVCTRGLDHVVACVVTQHPTVQHAGRRCLAAPVTICKWWPPSISDRRSRRNMSCPASTQTGGFASSRPTAAGAPSATASLHSASKSAGTLFLSHLSPRLPDRSVRSLPMTLRNRCRCRCHFGWRRQKRCRHRRQRFDMLDVRNRLLEQILSTRMLQQGPTHESATLKQRFEKKPRALLKSPGSCLRRAAKRQHDKKNMIIVCKSQNGDVVATVGGTGSRRHQMMGNVT